jgi:uncharacterized protein (TIGR02266 family)
MGIERRTMPRIETSLEIAFKNAGIFLCSYILNLSSGGIFIRTEQPLPVDAELEMRIQLPDDPEVMQLGGRVVWTKPQSNAYPAGMGVQFIGMPPVYRQKIHTFIEKSLRSKSQHPCPGKPVELSALFCKPAFAGHS